jgi:hypothetical protein
MESIQKYSFIKDDKKTRMKHGIRWQFACSLWFCPTDKQTICQIDLKKNEGLASSPGRRGGYVKHV